MVVDVFLISDAENADLAVLDRFAHAVERFGKPMNNVQRHACIDLASQLDELGRHFVFAGNPTQIKRVNRDAVTAEARPGIERLVTERLCLGSVNHFPDVDPDFLKQDFELIDHRDVDASVGVFQDLAGFSNFATRNGYRRRNSAGVQFIGQFPNCSARFPRQPSEWCWR